jgi:hypothetical protein
MGEWRKIYTFPQNSAVDEGINFMIKPLYSQNWRQTPVPAGDGQGNKRCLYAILTFVSMILFSAF